MKLLNKLKQIAILSLALLGITGCTDDEKADYINLSTNSYTFDSKGDETLTINIDAGKGWEVSFEEEWVLEKEKENNKLVIGVEASKSNTIRNARLTFTSGEARETFTVSQLGTNVTFAMLETTTADVVMSPNGTYVAAVDVSIVNNVYHYDPYIVTVAGGQREEKNTITSSSTTVAAIADNGLFLVNDATGQNSTRYFVENEQKSVPVPPGYKDGIVSATSADGRICVGYARNIAEAKEYPIRWVDMVPEVLEVPEKTLLGTDILVGVMARGCSADGSIIYGSVWDDFAGIYWKDGKVDYIAQDKIYIHDIIINHGGGDISIKVADRPIFTADKNRISPNGRYLSFNFGRVTAVDKAEKVIQYPALFNTETGETYIVEEIPDGFADGSSLTVADDGLLSFGCPATGTTHGFIHYPKSGKTVSVKDYISQEYGFSISSEETHIHRITNDGKTVLGANYLTAGVLQYWYLNILD